ncbi:MAG: hypothetical protein GAK35_01062 [Herbaspirillum frisingense]|uniref:Uncharacterized protein n=1 Tax=Herbaspirillum frisingense TaxID=92645 RepID=A0A7V8JVC2_9BURK|nr:MAG: hypothetical protein GAK35_01062 [Herbaspirillum frisingense]
MRPLQARLVGITERVLISRLDTRITRACPPPLFRRLRCRHCGNSWADARRPEACWWPRLLRDRSWTFTGSVLNDEVIQTPKGHSANVLSGWPLTAASRAISRRLLMAYHSHFDSRAALGLAPSGGASHLPAILLPSASTIQFGAGLPPTWLLARRGLVVPVDAAGAGLASGILIPLSGAAGTADVVSGSRADAAKAVHGYSALHHAANRATP